MNIKVKKLHKDAVIPKYAKHGDSGFDLVSMEDVTIKPGENVIIKTGVAYEIPVGFELQVRPRSGMSVKTPLRVILGTVDAGYRSDVGVIADNIGSEPFEVKRGDRVAQGVIAPVIRANLIEVDELSETERGNGGFGSTGITVK
ncbi:dUTP diphosphatase [Bacillus cereus]|nr:dUTP diphosphatase [Bacillus cereus]